MMDRETKFNAARPAEPCPVTGNPGFTKLEDLAARNMVAILREDLSAVGRNGWQIANQRKYARELAAFSVLAAEELLSVIQERE